MHDPAQQKEEVFRFRGQGFRAVKIRIRYEEIRHDLAVVAAVREEVREIMEIVVDANQGWHLPDDTYRLWDVRRTLQVACESEHYGVYWLELPLEHANFAGPTELRCATLLRITVGALNRSLVYFREFVSRGSAGILQPDIVVCGGFSLGLKVTHFCEQHGLRFYPHTWRNSLELMENLYLADVTGICPFLRVPF